jgi:RNA polymerase sigma factor (sigma-70 family)
MTTTIEVVEVTVEAIRKVNRDIKNYYWMSNQISKNDVEEYISSVTPKYGIEASLPKAAGFNSDPTYGAVQRKVREENRIKRYIETVKRLEDAVATLDDEKERMVIEGCMDRISLSQIGKMLGISKQAVFEIKEKAVRKLAVKMYLNP